MRRKKKKCKVALNLKQQKKNQPATIKREESFVGQRGEARREMVINRILKNVQNRSFGTTNMDRQTNAGRDELFVEQKGYGKDWITTIIVQRMVNEKLK